MELLPVEVWGIISQHLASSQVVQLRLLSHHFLMVVDSDYLWTTRLLSCPFYNQNRKEGESAFAVYKRLLSWPWSTRGLNSHNSTVVHVDPVSAQQFTTQHTQHDRGDLDRSAVVISERSISLRGKLASDGIARESDSHCFELKMTCANPSATVVWFGLATPQILKSRFFNDTNGIAYGSTGSVSHRDLSPGTFSSSCRYTTNDVIGIRDVLTPQLTEKSKNWLEEYSSKRTTAYKRTCVCFYRNKRVLVQRASNGEQFGGWMPSDKLHVACVLHGTGGERVQLVYHGDQMPAGYPVPKQSDETYPEEPRILWFH
eukprot:TRINITY_DN6612_c0_g1_i2.p1 TRINITY_DN6612_c0_g1~~TRINITY_DN6612_c0_g1_i2.p1  ORF type:complete len:315 (+),score=39.35 TRINITY_DN6612_c0_g1_i2:31-975(+)